jgi:hypothetical protein
MEYIRKHYKFTKEGDEFFRNEIRKWAAKKTTGKKSKPVKETKTSSKALPPLLLRLRLNNHNKRPSVTRAASR